MTSRTTDNLGGYVVAEYAKGRTLRDIATERGVALSWVHTCGKRAGLESRPSGQPPLSPDEWMVKRAKSLRRDGFSYRALARHLRVSKTHAHKLANVADRA